MSYLGVAYHMKDGRILFDNERRGLGWQKGFGFYFCTPDFGDIWVKQCYIPEKVCIYERSKLWLPFSPKKVAIKVIFYICIP